MMNYQYAIRYTLHKPPATSDQRQATSDKRPATPSARTIAQKNLFMQNKANLLNTQILVNCVLTMDYVNIRLRSRFKNKANQSQFKANLSQLKPISMPNKPKQTQPVVSLPALPALSLSKGARSKCRTYFKPASQSDSSILVRHPVRRSFSEDGSFMQRRIDFDFCSLIFFLSLSAYN